jgi:UDP-N-acetylmuramate dehydrogenase
MSWFSGFEALIRADVPLREQTWYRLGGPARWFCEPRDEQELADLLKRIRAEGIPWRLLGNGANVLVRDEGFDGAVIHLTGKVFERVTIDGTTIEAGAGADFPKLITRAMKHDLVGLEVLAGVPGSVGGIVRMNAGGRYGEIRQFVQSVRVLTPVNEISTLSAEQIGFAYRHTDLGLQIVLAATFALTSGDGEAAKQRYREIFQEKQRNQPPLAARSAGCIFKNPPGHAAGRLLDEAGLKGTRIGGAEISTRHANFILAYDNATAADVLNLIAHAKERVKQATGIELCPEVEIW